MSIYVQARIWLNKSKVKYSMFMAASRGSLIITLNMVVSYSYYVVMIGIRAYYEASWNNRFTCPGDKEKEKDNRNRTFSHLLLCDELYLSVAFMCLQCTVNSLILICQRRTRRFLWLCFLNVKGGFVECCSEYSDYEYL
jgi:hypothetical protein